MHFARPIALLATTYFAIEAYARPRPAPLSYSVVNVDGGQTTSALPTTVYQTITQSTDSDATVTIIQTTTTPIVQPAADPTATALIPEVSGYTIPTQPEAAPTSTAWETEAIPTTVTTTATWSYPPSPTTTSYYDDGMWHTYYPIKNVATGVPAWNNVPAKLQAPPVASDGWLARRAVPTGNGYAAGGWNQTSWQYSGAKWARGAWPSGHGASAASPTGY